MLSFNASARYGYGGKQYVARILGRHSKFTFNREFIGKKGGKRGEGTSADVDTPGLYETRDIDSKGRPDDTYYVVIAANDRLYRFEAAKEDAMKIGKEMDSGRSFDDIVAFVPGDSEAKATKATLQAQLEEVRKLKLSSWNDEVLASTVQLTRDVGPLAKDAIVTQRELQTEVDKVIEGINQGILSVKAAAADDWEFRTAKQASQAEAVATVESAIAGCWAIIQPLPEKEAKKVLKALKEKVSPPKEAPAETPAGATAE